jgi:succinate dehydrogenase / fumarate reductase cytochrome b subunit
VNGVAAPQTAGRAGATAGRTTVALKILMALTGALFVVYVLAHMYGNLEVFAGQEAFDGYAEHLRTLGEPILPYSGFLWLFRVALLLSLVGHAYAAFALWSRAMRWGGVALLAFLVFHLAQFTIVKPNLNPNVSTAQIGDSPYRLVVAGFQLWWVVVIYLVALVALALHLHHGVWSAAQTLGLTSSTSARRKAKTLGVFLAALVAVGFALPPLAILFGFVT